MADYEGHGYSDVGREVGFLETLIFSEELNAKKEFGQAQRRNAIVGAGKAPSKGLGTKILRMVEMGELQ